jgi:glutamate carboxypeptidase
VSISIAEFTVKTDEMLRAVRELVAIESPSTDKAAIDRMGALLAARCRTLGAAVEVDPQTVFGDNLIARWGSGPDAILLMCHMDTVYNLGALARQPWRESEGRAYGPGALDMKASIVIALTALEVLGARRTRPVSLLLTSDEEIGSAGARPLIEREAQRHALTLCLEPCLPDGSLKTARKGIGDVEIVARGRAAHAGTNHKEGRNAIEELAHHILAAQRLTDYARGTTVNVGVITGGSRSNVVPEEARAVIDYRVSDQAEAARMQAWMDARRAVLPGMQLEVRGGLNRPPMPRDALMAATFARAQAIGQTLGLQFGEGSTGGGSDANFVAPLGVPVLDGLGAGGNGAHSEREHILINSLPERAALLAALILHWG